MSQFDVEGKPRAWHTAFFYLAEHVRLLTDGALNHKGLYALVGTEGRYLNHNNPTVRKRTAGALSRLVHSARYAKDMRDQYQQDYTTFVRAADEVCAKVCEARAWDDASLASYLILQCWPDVREGLANERMEWRGDMGLSKVDIEMAMLFSTLEDGRMEGVDARKVTGSEADSPGSSDKGKTSETLLAAILHVLAFGKMNASFSRELLDQYPTGTLDQAHVDDLASFGACLVKFVDADHSALVGTTTIPAGRPFTIGRYTDCDIVETDQGVSRIHCYLYRMGGVWNFEDRESRNGSCVLRDGRVVYDSARDGAGVAVPLRHGDCIVLAGRSHYWFGALAVAPPVGSRSSVRY